ERRAGLERFFFAPGGEGGKKAEAIKKAPSAPGGQSATQSGPPGVPFNGAVHNPYPRRTAARRLPPPPRTQGEKSCVEPVENLAAINVEEYRKRGDYIIFTLKPPANQ